MKPTKATACKVMGRKPTKRQYEKTAAADSVDPLPTNHKLPPYGGTCWVQAYYERLAYERLAEAQRAYLQALDGYIVAWQATEDCLTGVPT
jgi:formylglycine-generating enzyme required for sulfatase activity